MSLSATNEPRATDPNTNATVSRKDTGGQASPGPGGRSATGRSGGVRGRVRCVGLGTPSDYADGFRRLASAGVVDRGLADRLVRAAGFRNIVAHVYSRLDLGRVYRAAQDGPADLIAFLAAVRDLLSKS